MSWYNGEIEGEIVAAPTGSISACAPNASTCAAPTGSISACAPNTSTCAAPTGSISACAPNTSTCAANPIHQKPLTYEMIVDCCKELKDIQQSEIDNFNNIVKLFEDKNALLTECLYFLSAFVDDDFCHSLKQRVEKNLGIRFKRKDSKKTNEPWVDAYVDEDRTISKRMTLDEFIKNGKEK